MSGIAAFFVAVAAFVAMEPVTAATHRWVMHGIGERLHRSHHRSPSADRPPSRFETNDWYPVIFAALVNVGFYAGLNWDGFAGLVPVGVGVTAYGMSYALVHDVYIHGRLGSFAQGRIAAFDRLADAHRIHHLYNEAPYGMLVPIVPSELRTRAARTQRDPFGRRNLDAVR